MPGCKGEGWDIIAQEGGLCRGNRAESWKEKPQELLAYQEFLQAQAS